MTRRGHVLMVCATVLAIGGLFYQPAAPKLIWNASASVPIGLYVVQPAGHLTVGDVVAVNAPEPIASFLANGGYLPRGVPLLKSIAGLPGQEVCRTGRTITIDGIIMGEALERDRRGRALPAWQGCRRLAAGELFLMNRAVRDSLDGRTFGPIPRTSIIGRAVPLWTNDTGPDRFAGRADARRTFFPPHQGAFPMRRMGRSTCTTSRDPERSERG